MKEGQPAVLKGDEQCQNSSTKEALFLRPGPFPSPKFLKERRRMDVDDGGLKPGGATANKIRGLVGAPCPGGSRSKRTKVCR